MAVAWPAICSASLTGQSIRFDEIADRNNSIREDLGPHAAPIAISFRKSRLASDCGRDVAWPCWFGAAQAHDADAKFFAEQSIDVDAFDDDVPFAAEFR